MCKFVNVWLHTHIFILSTYKNAEYSYICACVYWVCTYTRFICYLLVRERKAEENSLFSTVPLGNIFFCLSQIHTQYLLKCFPINTRFEQFHDLLHPIFCYIQQNMYFLIDIMETHQGFHVTQLKFTVHSQKSVPGKYFRVWWCPMEKDLQKSPE